MFYHQLYSLPKLSNYRKYNCHILYKDFLLFIDGNTEITVVIVQKTVSEQKHFTKNWRNVTTHSEVRVGIKDIN